MNTLRLCLLSFCLFAVAACGQVPAGDDQPTDSFDWRTDWGVKEGFTIEIDTEGYRFPSAIVFVPSPGTAPDDPLYFVTEVRGTVKVVTNDRSVHTFAQDFFQLEPEEELPAGQGQAGLAGICLDPTHGYVYVTFAYQDEDGVLRNNVVRFQTEPETFSLKPTGQTAFTDVFYPHETGLAHHIGPCQVQGDLLYVSVGEGWQPYKATQVDAMYGKIIRMTLDGKPVPTNPFYQDGDISRVANYVWVNGLRNPFGITLIEDRMFVADNGNNIDRFLEVEPGENYLWNGNDRSIASNADFVFSPSAAPVQMDYHTQNTSVFPQDYRRRFYVALSAYEPERGKIPGIMAIDYNLDTNMVESVPGYFVKYRGDTHQMVTGLAFGPDGLYFAPLHANAAGQSPILKVRYDEDSTYPTDLVQTDDAMELMREKGCLGCHTIDDNWGFGGTAGPPLDSESLIERLDERLHSDEYVESLGQIDSLDTEPQREYAQARQEVLNADGRERIRTWIKYRLLEPRFDNQYSQMPNLGLTEAEATIITEYLLAGDEVEDAGVVERIASLLPSRYGRKHMLAILAGGIAFGAASTTVLGGIVVRRKIRCN